MKLANEIVLGMAQQWWESYLGQNSVSTVGSDFGSAGVILASDGRLIGKARRWDGEDAAFVGEPDATGYAVIQITRAGFSVLGTWPVWGDSDAPLNRNEYEAYRAAFEAARGDRQAVLHE